MSDIEPTPDELVSAYIDGELTDDQRRRVESDPILLARVQQFLAVSEAVASPVPPPPAGHRDHAIAAALAASPTSPKVQSIAVARASRRSPRVVAIASVAAVVAVVLLVVPIVLNSRGDSQADFSASDAFDEAETTDGASTEGADRATADAPLEEAAEEADPAELEAEAPAEQEAAAEEEAPAAALDADDTAGEGAPADAEADFAPAPLDLEEFASIGELRSFIVDNRDSLAGPLIEADACGAELLEMFQSQTTEVQATALAGTFDVLAYVVLKPDGGAQLVLFNRDTCGVISQQTLPV